jgi:hypothetical protein
MTRRKDEWLRCSAMMTEVQLCTHIVHAVSPEIAMKFMKYFKALLLDLMCRIVGDDSS